MTHVTLIVYRPGDGAVYQVALGAHPETGGGPSSYVQEAATLELRPGDSVQIAATYATPTGEGS
jgi:hypothetical protein